MFVCLCCLFLTKCDYINNILHKIPNCYDNQVKEMFNKLLEDDKKTFEIVLSIQNLFDLKGDLKINNWKVENYVEESLDKINKKRQCFADVVFNTNNGDKKQQVKYIVSVKKSENGDMVYVELN